MDYKNATKDKSDIGSMITGISKNVLLSIVFTMTALLIFAFLITYTETDTSYISAIIIVITIASIILSAFLNGKKSSEKGWLTGVLSGFIYMLILYI
ncbi:MAG: TIGR04086 family membrane protein, partial [Clostridia bacterium]|nr:TIGR04086 family membrane protein [Clostridia bacterium]